MIKSQIGWIVSKLFFDKYPQQQSDKLQAKDRMKLIKEIIFLINSTDKCEIELSGNCYNQDGTLAEIPPIYEEEYILTN